MEALFNGAHIAAIEAFDRCRAVSVRDAVERLGAPAVLAAYLEAQPRAQLAQAR